MRCAAFYYDAGQDRRLVFLTNNFDLPALTIALLYKSLEGLFFKWIKQHLRMTFFGTRAVKTHIAVSVYVLDSQEAFALEPSLHQILQRKESDFTGLRCRVYF